VPRSEQFSKNKEKGREVTFSPSLPSPEGGDSPQQGGQLKPGAAPESAWRHWKGRRGFLAKERRRISEQPRATEKRLGREWTSSG